MFQDGQIIKLKPHVTVLSEIVVSDFASNLMSHTYEKAIKNSDFKNYQKAFYRQITTNNDIATEAQEIFYTIESDNGGIMRNRIDEARYAQKKRKDSTELVFHYTNASAMTLGSHIYSEIPAAKKEVLLPLMP